MPRSPSATIRAPFPALLLLAACPGAVSAAGGGRVDFLVTDMQDSDAALRMEQRDLFAGTTLQQAHFDLHPGPESGVRFTAWDDAMPWTISAELGYFETHDSRLDLNVATATVAAGWRAHNALLPQAGGLHPYAMAGIAMLMMQGEARLGALESDVQGGTWYTTPDWSPYVAAGLEWNLSPRIALVAEYRYREIRLDSTSTNNLFFPTSNTHTTATFDASGVTFGISWRPATGTMAHEPAAASSP